MHLLRPGAPVRTSNSGGLRELLDLRLRATESAIMQTQARDARLIAEALEKEL